MNMTDVETIKDLINLWPTRADLALDLTAVLGEHRVSADQVHKWARSNSIPARFHFAVVRAGTKRGFDVTADAIARLHSPNIACDGHILMPAANEEGAIR